MKRNRAQTLLRLSPIRFLRANAYQGFTELCTALFLRPGGRLRSCFVVACRAQNIEPNEVAFINADDD